MQRIDVTNEVKTVVCPSSDVGNLLFYKGVCLAYIEYDNDPQDIEGMSVYFIEQSNGSFDLMVETPVIGSESIDYHRSFSLSKEAFARFQRKAYDPLRRGAYPLQSKLDDGYLLELTHVFNISDSRIYMDKLLLELMIQTNEKSELYEDAFEEVRERLKAHISTFESEGLNCHNLITSGHKCSIKRYEDYQGKFIVVEMSLIPIQETVPCEIQYEPKSKTYYLSVNGRVVDIYVEIDDKSIVGLSNPDIRVEKMVIEKLKPEKCLHVPFHKSGKKDFDVLKDAEVISTNQAVQGYTIPRECFTFNRYRARISEIEHLGMIDYRFLISEHIPTTRFDKITRMGYYEVGDERRVLIGQ